MAENERIRTFTPFGETVCKLPKLGYRSASLGRIVFWTIDGKVVETYPREIILPVQVE